MTINPRYATHDECLFVRYKYFKYGPLKQMRQQAYAGHFKQPNIAGQQALSTVHRAGTVVARSLQLTWDRLRAKPGINNQQLSKSFSILPSQQLLNILAASKSAATAATSTGLTLTSRLSPQQAQADCAQCR